MRVDSRQIQRAQAAALSGAWTPASPTTDGGRQPNAWYDANAITGLADGDAVSSWPDVQDNFHLTQSVTELKPMYVVSAVNGLPVVRFDGTHVLVTPSPVPLRTVFSVTKWGLGSYNVLYGHSNSVDFHGSNFSTLWLNTSFASAAVVNGSARKNGADSTPATITKTTSEYAVTMFQTTAVVYFNRTMDRTFATRGFLGDCGEMILYGDALSAADIAQVETYLATKWGITLA